MNEFVEFPKIPRLFRSVVVTEKIDGTNAQVYISDTGPITLLANRVVPFLVGSRSRWIFPENDNAGFARWAYEHEAELLQLGPGSHFGEWWGAGIQRRYGLTEKRFSLFNVGRWHDFHGTNEPTSEKSAAAPACCYVVPILASATEFRTTVVEEALYGLRAEGSKAAPGFMQPEGVVAFHAASGGLFKATLEKDQEHKGVGHEMARADAIARAKGR